MQVGTAQADITPQRPLPICGQLGVRLGERMHDPLSVNAIALAQGEMKVVVVSCDLLLLPDDLVRSVQAACQDAHNIAPNHAILSATHTHLAPCTVDYLFGATDADYLAELRRTIVRVVDEALADLEEAALFAGEGAVEELAYNRRGLRSDGSAEIYHGSWNADFAGVEGPRDGAVPVIFARRPNGSLKAVVTSFASHPNCMEDERFYSADLPGAVRMFLREKLGSDLSIVYLTGAAGNAAPTQLENNPKMELPWRGEAGWRRSGQYLGAEIARVIEATTLAMAEPALALQQMTLQLPVRSWPAEFNPQRLSNDRARDYYGRAQAMWPALMGKPADVHLAVLRLGDAAICFNPGEPYAELGLAIKRNSPAQVTMIGELANGYCGYIPTREAFSRGGYCTQPALTSKLEIDAGEQLVRSSQTLLRQCFARTSDKT